MENGTAVSSRAKSQVAEGNGTIQTNGTIPPAIYNNGVKLGPRHAPGKDVFVEFSPAQRRLMKVFFTVNRTLSLCIFAYLVSYFTIDKWLPMIFTLLVGMTIADLLSGIMHWGVDTYGTVPMWLDDYGSFFVNFQRKNREHHTDPSAVTRYDMWESNGNVHCATSIVFGLTPQLLILYTSTPEQIQAKYFIHWIFFLAIFLTSVSPQIHTWSHTYFGLPRWIRFLQRCHLFLPPRHHAKHHFVPHDTFYCIINGWVDYPMEYFDGWRKIEATIEYFTGIKPRVNDLVWLKTMGFISDHPDLAGTESVIEYHEIEQYKSK